jgi:predicted acyl esterase
VAPDGTALLVTRGAYRVDVPAYDQVNETIRLPFFGNHWAFAEGHRLRLDLTQSDTPTFRASTPESVIAFDPPTLELPIRPAGTLSLTGA